MANTLHFDCSAGISGDMVLGALVDLGVDQGELIGELEKLSVGGWKLDFVRETRNGVPGLRALVQVEEDTNHERHDHNHHAHNSWKEIRRLIETAGLREGAKKRALEIFTRIAEAEAQVHGAAVQDVTFHEVGALDSIIDIVGAAACLDILGPEKITCGEIELGGGTVRCAHGVLPVPAPATAILTQNLPVKRGGYDKEMTTPTGAAILAAQVNEFITGPADFRNCKTGAGIGSHIFPGRINALRVFLLEE